ncbi:MAG: hypothetical protein ACJ0BE_06640 [Dehalococcoidia bacterium]
MVSQYCPNCQSLVIASDQNCSVCNFDLSYENLERQQIYQSAYESAANQILGNRHIYWAIGFIVIGTAISLGSFLATESGTYLVTWGIVLYGLYRLIIGLPNASNKLRILGISITLICAISSYWLILGDGSFTPSNDFTKSSVDVSAMPEVRDCLDSSGLVVKCAASQSVYEVTNAIRIKSNTLPTDFSRYDQNCPSDTQGIFTPTKETWAEGDRAFLCVKER